MVYVRGVSWLDRMGRGVRTTIAIAFTSALVVVGLINGACTTTPPSGHCWRPGACYEVSSSSDCGANESFDVGPCTDVLRVGTCVGASGQTLHLYAPLHGLLPPNCERLMGPGAHYQPE